MTYKTTVLRGKDIDIEIDIEIEYSISAGCRGARDSLCGIRGAGPALEPDEDPEVEIESVIEIETGNEFELTDKEVEEITQKIWNKAADDAQDYDDTESDSNVYYRDTQRFED